MIHRQMTSQAKILSFVIDKWLTTTLRVFKQDQELNTVPFEHLDRQVI